MHAGEEIHPLPAPLASLSLVREVKGTVIVSSLRGIREAGHFDAYRAHLAPADRDALSLVVAGEWIPVDFAMAHYRACDALGLAPAEIVRLGAAMAQRLNSNYASTLAKIARTSGATPWTALMHLQRTFEASYRGWGGTRVIKLGPKEARVDVVAIAVLGIPWSRQGWRGLLAANLEGFCERCYATEVASTSTSASFRLAWV